jgi:hypothetical protein
MAAVLQIGMISAAAGTRGAQECQGQQRRVSAGGAIDLHKIARPEILDPGRIQRDHLPDVLFTFRVLIPDPTRIVNA